MSASEELDRIATEAGITFSRRAGTTDGPHTRAVAPTGPMAKATQLKSQGNDAMKGRKFQLAVRLYTAALIGQEAEDGSIPGQVIDQYNAIVLSNRAQAWIKLGRYVEVVEDCTESLRLDKLNTKSRYRLGQAYKALGKKQQAIEALEVVVTQLPTQTQPAKDLAQLIFTEDIGLTGSLVTHKRFKTCTALHQQAAITILRQKSNDLTQLVQSGCGRALCDLLAASKGKEAGPLLAKLRHRFDAWLNAIDS